MKDYEGMEELDDTTKRELKIVALLKSKASQARTRVTKQHSDQSMDAQANLLLSLQQSQSQSQTRNINFIHHQRSASEGTTASSSATSPQLMYPTLQSGLQSLTPTSGTPIPMIGPMPPPQSPTFQRIQGDATSSARHSPIGSGSPGADEDSSAQSLLDYWCNAVTNPPPLLLDNFTTNSLSGQWGTFTSATSDVSSWLNTPYLLGGDAAVVNGVEGADNYYWENLVNQIRGGPMT